MVSSFLFQYFKLEWALSEDRQELEGQDGSGEPEPEPGLDQLLQQ